MRGTTVWGGPIDSGYRRHRHKRRSHRNREERIITLKQGQERCYLPTANVSGWSPAPGPLKRAAPRLPAGWGVVRSDGLRDVRG